MENILHELIIISGLPSSGKTYRAKQLVEHFTKRANRDNVSADVSSKTSNNVAIALKDENGIPSSSISQPDVVPLPSSSSSPSQNYRIHHISDHSLSLSRSTYATGPTEKTTRAAIYSAVKRSLGKHDVVIIDSMNYIKGWRYQLSTEAKNAGTGCCVLHVGTMPERAREVNNARLKKARAESNEDSIGSSGEQDSYEESVLEELLMRFEEPNPMARWDSPLFAVIWEDDNPPSERIWNEVVLGLGADGKKGKAIKPNQATVLPPSTSSDHLYHLDRATSAILTRIQQYQNDHPGEGGGVVPVTLENTTATLEVLLPSSPPSFPQLQRLRRQFMAMHRQQMGSMGMGGVGGGGSTGVVMLTPQRVGELFVDWLNDAFDQ